MYYTFAMVCTEKFMFLYTPFMTCECKRYWYEWGPVPQGYMYFGQAGKCKDLWQAKGVCYHCAMPAQAFLTIGSCGQCGLRML